MDAAIAYFLTWTTYGTWLHGDARGSVEKPKSSRRRAYAEEQPALAAYEATLAGSRFFLCDEARHIVDQTIVDHAAIRRWTIEARNVRTNHVHIVMRRCDKAPEAVMTEFKAWATRRLREHRFVAPSQRVWTLHGSTRWIHSNASLAAAIDYVARLQ